MELRVMPACAPLRSRLSVVTTGFGTEDDAVASQKDMRTVVILIGVLQLQAGVGDQIPKLAAKPLSGGEVRLPGGAKIAAYVLSFGFSSKCDKAVAAWDKRIAPVYSSDPRVAYYEIPVLEGLPGLIRPLVLHGMRRVIPKADQTRFAPVFEGETALKNIVGFQDPDAAYVVVATGSGKVVWTSHAPASEAAFAELRKSVSEILR